MTIVFYHGNCSDGVAAAWMFTQRKGLLRNIQGDTVFYAVYDRTREPNLSSLNLNDKRVFIVDFCYPLEILTQILAAARVVTIIDHHKTTKSIIPPKLVDITKCAAELTWNLLFNANDRPWWVQHIRDKDLWLWEHPDSKKFMAALLSLGSPSFANYDKVNQFTDEERKSFLIKGESILEDEQKELIKRCEGARLMNFGPYTVYAISSVRMRTEIGNMLALKPECDFAFIYNFDAGNQPSRWLVSLRGEANRLKEKNIDLSQIAAFHGGGGHQCASGFCYYGVLSDLITAKRRPRIPKNNCCI